MAAFLSPAAMASASAPSTNASSSGSRPCSSLTFILHWPPRCSTLSFTTTRLSARGMPPISESAKVLGGFLLALPPRPPLRASVFLRTHVVPSGPDAGVGASGRAARGLPERYTTPRSRRRHPAGWGVTLVLGGSFLHRTGHGVAAPTFTSAIWPRSAAFSKLPFPAEPKPDLSRPRWASSRAFC